MLILFKEIDHEFSYPNEAGESVVDTTDFIDWILQIMNKDLTKAQSELLSGLCINFFGDTIEDFEEYRHVMPRILRKVGEIHVIERTNTSLFTQYLMLFCACSMWRERRRRRLKKKLLHQKHKTEILGTEEGSR